MICKSVVEGMDTMNYFVDSAIKKVFTQITSDEKVKQALCYIEEDQTVTVEEQKAIVVIEAPTFHEEKRAGFYAKKLRELGLADVAIDKHGNVLGRRQGKGNGPTILLEGHLDTVFAAGTDLTPREENGRIYAPGIGDDTRALAANLSVLRALDAAGIELAGDLIIAGTAAEEGLGGMGGMQGLLRDHPEIAATISIDGAGTESIVYNATGIKNYEVTYTGPGGHAYSNFGTPSALHAAARAVAELANMETLVCPKTTFTVSLMEAGHAIHAIAQNAVFKINMRSDDATELDLLEQRALALFRLGADAENARWGKPLISVDYKKILDIPAGSQSDDSSIVQAAWQAIGSLGIEPRLIPGGCTNANMAIHSGIPAVTLGRGGTSGGVHTLEEWFDPTDAYLSTQTCLLLLLALTGIHGVSDSVVTK